MRLLAIVALVVAAAPVGAGPASVFLKGRVFDSAGKPVGSVLYARDSGVVVVRKVNGVPVLIHMTHEGFGGGTAGVNVQFYHESVDCSGERFIAALTPAPLFRDTWADDRSQHDSRPPVYYFAGDPMALRTFRAWEGRIVNCEGIGTPLADGWCCMSAANEYVAGPARIAIEPSDFRPPFKLK